tara:strand:+ start:429 stop:1292 length:864 start_codon:yes stop_codon:yes gene_type:complete
MNSLIINQFYEYLEKFLQELSKSSSKTKKCIDKEYKDIKDEKYIECIKNNIFIHKEKFLGKQEELDDFFKENQIELLDKINISEIWGKSDKDNKNAIIQYIKVFVFMFETSNKDTDDCDEECEQESESNDTENKTTKDFEEMLKKSLLENEENVNSFYKTMEEKDNSIVDLAKNIAEELKGNSSEKDMMNMFNGQGLNGLIGTITSKLDSRMKSGDLDQNKLFSDAQKMMGSNNNLFGNLFNNLNIPQSGSQPFQNASTPEVKEENLENVKTEAKANIKKKKKTKKK